MTGLPEGSDAALAPLRATLMEAARASAAAIVADAEAQATVVVREATQQTEELRRASAASGEEAARSQSLLRSAGVRRQAHEIVLREQSALRQELQRQVGAAASALRDDPRYPELLDRLGGRCRAILGEDATISESADGGVTGHASTRSVDLSLPAIAAQTFALMTPEVSALWAS